MKKFAIAALSAACLVFAVVFGGCNSGEAAVEYRLSEDGTHYIVSDVSGNLRALTEYEVPAQYCAEEGGQALPVTEIGDEAFYGCTRLKKVTLPDTVTRIGVRAFTRCALEHVAIPESVKVIDYCAFGNCGYLKEITVPQSVESLGELAFSRCTSLKTAVVKANIETLGYRTFFNSAYSHAQTVYHNTSLEKVYLPSTLKKIHVSALAGNIITDIYFAGSEEQWNRLYFYEEVKKVVDGKETEELEEKKYEKKDVTGNAQVHFDSEF